MNEWVKEFFSSEGPGRKLRRLKRGDLLFKRGSDAKYVYMIQQGEISLTAPHIRAPEICHPNYWLFEGAHELGHVHLTSAIALTDCAVIAFEAEMFNALLAEYPILQHKFLQDMANRVNEKSNNLGPADQRLARALLLLCNGKQVAIQTTPQRLSELIGTSRQTADKLLNRFVTEGLVKKLRSDLYLPDIEALEKFARTRK
jgi:CRP-like cAMP-binding protein